jgi:hypothetical protein
MDHRQRILAAVILTIVVSLSVGFVTEYVRQSMTFSWAIEEGDGFIFDVIVTGQTTNSTVDFPLPFVDMNNTRISVEIISLPNVSITFYSGPFLENIVEHTKTSSRFSNGTEIPAEHRFTINRHVSRCVLPIGGWLHLDSLFPNHINQPFTEYESYISVFRRPSFYFGYIENETYKGQGWYGIIDLETGVPLTVSFWHFLTSQALTYWYNVTMNLVT